MSIYLFLALVAIPFLVSLGAALESNVILIINQLQHFPSIISHYCQIPPFDWIAFASLCYILGCLTLLLGTR